MFQSSDRICCRIWNTEQPLFRNFGSEHGTFWALRGVIVILFLLRIKDRIVILFWVIIQNPGGTLQAPDMALQAPIRASKISAFYMFKFSRFLVLTKYNRRPSVTFRHP